MKTLARNADVCLEFEGGWKHSPDKIRYDYDAMDRSHLINLYSKIRVYLFIIYIYIFIIMTFRNIVETSFFDVNRYLRAADESADTEWIVENVVSTPSIPFIRILRFAGASGTFLRCRATGVQEPVS